jgi:nicotinamidase-related amidase
MMVCSSSDDCCASYPDEWHRFAVQNIMPLIATVTSSQAVLQAFAGRQASRG